MQQTWWNRRVSEGSFFTSNIRQLSPTRLRRSWQLLRNPWQVGYKSFAILRVLSVWLLFYGPVNSNAWDCRCVASQRLSQQTRKSTISHFNQHLSCIALRQATYFAGFVSDSRAFDWTSIECRVQDFLVALKNTIGLSLVWAKRNLRKHSKNKLLADPANGVWFLCFPYATARFFPDFFSWSILRFPYRLFCHHLKLKIERFVHSRSMLAFSGYKFGFLLSSASFLFSSSICSLSDCRVEYFSDILVLWHV